jgi:hypothetical protein
MNEIAEKNSNEQRISGRRAAIVLIVLSILTSLGRVYTRNEPLERDLTMYALVAHELVEGKRLYTDVWDQKPPAIYLVYAAAELAVGYGPQSVLLVNIAAGLITLAGVYRAASAAGMGRVSGLWAAGLWSIISLNIDLEANQPNTEVFINACMIWVFVIFVGAKERPISYPKAVWLGLIAAAATLFKHHSVLPFATVAIAYVIGTAEAKQFRAGRLVGALIAFGTIVFCWAAIAGYFAFGGRFKDFYDAVILYNMYHPGNLFYNLIDGLEPGRAKFLFMAILLPVAAITAYFGGVLRRGVSPFALMAGFAAGIFLEVSCTRWWFTHYFQLWLPALCVSLGWSYRLLDDMMSGKRGVRRLLPHIGVGMIVAPFLLSQLLTYRLTPLEIAVRKHEPNFPLFVVQAEEINQILKPSESFYHFGDDTGLYYYAKRRPPVSVFWYYPLFMGPLTESLSKRVVAELEQNRPDMLVYRYTENLERFTPDWRDNPVLQWYQDNYVPFPDNDSRDYYKLGALKGSDLERRIFGNSGQDPNK